MTFAILLYLSLGVVFTVMRLMHRTYADELRQERALDASWRTKDKLRPISDREWCAWKTVQLLLMTLVWPILAAFLLTNGGRWKR